MKQTIEMFVRRRLQVMRETQALRRIPSVPCQSRGLRLLTHSDVAAVLDSVGARQDWTQTEGALAQVCRIEDGKTGGVNPGDRRALWCLVKGLGATSVLEIGTHVGASTLHIAAAMRSVARPEASIRPLLVTVDVHDVNDAVSGYWKKYGLTASPRDMLQNMECGDFVSFVTDDSLSYLDRCKDAFDFIFLDGDHSATTVYQEIPRALNVLRKDGVILLHDFFPRNRPLWARGSVAPGPYLAVRRLRREGVSLKAIPLGALPWETKLGSRMTSLALVTRDS